eukprot:TRINITY_DN17048_c0_g1_i1.p1 TRINITY_DN17048_c0_g1~~TRINITY_DN17048_c0_g1_i1.p1  ORF type:complete len:260 (+),score=57.07 TRINITY_DN17048_c0_g1_i1:115-780(+)
MAHKAPGTVSRHMAYLVNPVTSSAPSDPRLFLLDSKELGRLRFLMYGFPYFSLSPSATLCAQSSSSSALRGEKPRATLDLKAKRNVKHPLIFDGEGRVFLMREEGAATEEAEDPASALLEKELGSLRQLHMLANTAAVAAAAVDAAGGASAVGVRIGDGGSGTYIGGAPGGVHKPGAKGRHEWERGDVGRRGETWWGSGGFDEWLATLRPRYCALVSSWAG